MHKRLDHAIDSSDAITTFSDEKEGSRPSQVFGSIQIVLSSLNCLSTMVVRAGIVTGGTLWETSLACWFLAINSEEGNKATFSHLPRLDT